MCYLGVNLYFKTNSDLFRSSLNKPFGSGIVTPSGILLNSQILDFTWPNKTHSSSPNPVHAPFFLDGVIIHLFSHNSINCSFTFSLCLVSFALAQQPPAWEEAHVLSDAHSGEASRGVMWHIRGHWIFQWRESTQWHYTGNLHDASIHYIRD